MSENDVTRQLELQQQRMETLLQRVGELSAQLPASAVEVFTALCTAVEELRACQEELRRQNEALTAARRTVEAERRQYQELFDFIPDGYPVTDTAGVIRQVNRAAAALLAVPLLAYWLLYRNTQGGSFMQTLLLRKTTLTVLPLAGLLWTAPVVSAHDEHQAVHEGLNAEHQAEHQELNAEHRAEHQELNAEHRAAHELPMTRRQHRRLHRRLAREHRAEHQWLNAEHQAEHEELNAEHQDYHDFNR